MSQKRIARELQDLKKESLPDGCSAAPQDDSIFEWNATIRTLSLSYYLYSLAIYWLGQERNRGSTRVSIWEWGVQFTHHFTTRLSIQTPQSCIHDKDLSCEYQHSGWDLSWV